MNIFLRAIFGLFVMASAGTAFGADDPYHDQLQSYKAEISRDPLQLQNSGFYGALAASQAKRAILGGAPGEDLVLLNGDGSTRERGGISIASPTINGRVNGNVNIILEPGAVKGKVTSVRR